MTAWGPCVDGGGALAGFSLIFIGIFRNELVERFRFFNFFNTFNFILKRIKRFCNYFVWLFRCGRNAVGLRKKCE